MIIVYDQKVVAEFIISLLFICLFLYLKGAYRQSPKNDKIHGRFKGLCPAILKHCFVYCYVDGCEPAAAQKSEPEEDSTLPQGMGGKG